MVRGDLADLDVLRESAVTSDGVIHLAFDHAAMSRGDMATAVDTDLAVVRAIGAALAGSGKPFVGTGGTLILATPPMREAPGTEDEVPAPGPRVDAENYVIGLADNGVRSSVVRLAPLVHSELDHHGFTVTLMQLAKEAGAAAYIGDGANRWPAVNTHDAATLYRLALEKAPAGSRLHAVEGIGMSRRSMAQAMAEQLGVEAVSIDQDQAEQYLGFLAAFAALDGPISAARTMQTLGWQPTHRDWLGDVRAGVYSLDQ